MRRVLVLNAGSSSLKWVVLDAQSEVIQQQGTASWDGTEGGRHAAEVARALGDVKQVDAVGHRVVHGGQRFQQSVLVDQAVRDGIQDLADLAPLHNPAALAGIDAAQQRFGPDVPQVAAFDTAFHASLPEPAAIYPLAWQWIQQWGVRRFGFHGLSVQHAVSRATELLQSPPEKLVVCHLGAGCSATAVLDGRSVDTSMGFTPLEGLMMVRRSGSVDPGLMLYLLGRMSADELDRGLNEQAGLAGVSGVSADLRAVQAAADTGDRRSRLAIEMFVHRVVATVGGLVAVLNGLDALVFTGGIGENSAAIRAEVASHLSFLGLRLDASANADTTSDAVVSAPDSRIQVLVITAREDLAVVREVRRVLGWT